MKSLLLLSLIVLGSFFIFDRFGSSNPSIENPTASTPTVPQSVLTASEGKSRFAILIPIQAAQKSLLSVLNLQSLMENLRVCENKPEKNSHDRARSVVEIQIKRAYNRISPTHTTGAQTADYGQVNKGSLQST